MDFLNLNMGLSMVFKSLIMGLLNTNLWNYIFDYIIPYINLLDPSWDFFVPYGVSYGTLKYLFIEIFICLYNSIYKFTGPIMGFVFGPYGVSYGSSKYPFSCTHYGTFDRL